MSKIYKTFEDWYDSLLLLKLSDKDHIVAQAAWNARNAEIDQLKQRIKGLELMVARLTIGQYEMTKLPSKDYLMGKVEMTTGEIK